MFLFTVCIHFNAIENFLIFILFGRCWTYDINLLSYLLRLTLMNLQNRIALLLSLAWIPHWMKVRMLVYIHRPMCPLLSFICKMSSLQSFVSTISTWWSTFHPSYHYISLYYVHPCSDDNYVQ